MKISRSPLNVGLAGVAGGIVTHSSPDNEYSGNNSKFNLVMRNLIKLQDKWSPGRIPVNASAGQICLICFMMVHDGW